MPRGPVLALACLLGLVCTASSTMAQTPKRISGREIDAVLGLMPKPLAPAVRVAQTWFHAFPPLDLRDEDIDRENHELPAVPAACAVDGCTQCPDNPHARLRQARARLARNRRVFDDFVEYYNNMMALGDAIGGLHGAAGLVWLDEKLKMGRYLDEVRAAYDDGYRENMQKAQQALIDIGRCEAEVYHSPDWYGRFGYFHFELLAQHYKRTR